MLLACRCQSRSGQRRRLLLLGKRRALSAAASGALTPLSSACVPRGRTSPLRPNHTRYNTGAAADKDGGPAFVTFPNVGQGGSLHLRIQRVPIQIQVGCACMGRLGTQTGRPLIRSTPFLPFLPLTPQIKSAWIDHTELRVEAPPSAPALEVADSSTGEGEPGALVVSDARLNFAPNALLGTAYAKTTMLLTPSTPWPDALLHPHTHMHTHTHSADRAVQAHGDGAREVQPPAPRSEHGGGARRHPVAGGAGGRGGGTGGRDCQQGGGRHRGVHAPRGRPRGEIAVRGVLTCLWVFLYSGGVSFPPGILIQQMNMRSYVYYICSGPRIELGAEHGCVFVGKYVEGDIAVRAQRVSGVTEQTAPITTYYPL